MMLVRLWLVVLGWSSRVVLITTFAVWFLVMASLAWLPASLRLVVESHWPSAAILVIVVVSVLIIVGIVTALVVIAAVALSTHLTWSHVLTLRDWLWLRLRLRGIVSSSVLRSEGGRVHVRCSESRRRWWLLIHLVRPLMILLARIDTIQSTRIHRWRRRAAWLSRRCWRWWHRLLAQLIHLCILKRSLRLKRLRMIVKCLRHWRLRAKWRERDCLWVELIGSIGSREGRCHAVGTGNEVLGRCRPRRCIDIHCTPK